MDVVVRERKHVALLDKTYSHSICERPFLVISKPDFSYNVAIATEESSRLGLAMHPKFERLELNKNGWGFRYWVTDKLEYISIDPYAIFLRDVGHYETHTWEAFNDTEKERE